MTDVATMSETGEIKIPVAVQRKLGFEPGQRFDVQVKANTLLLVPLGLPGDEQVKEFIQWTKANPAPEPLKIPPRPAARRVTARKSKTSTKRRR